MVAKKRCANCGQADGKKGIEKSSKWFCCKKCADEFSRKKTCEFC